MDASLLLGSPTAAAVLEVLALNRQRLLSALRISEMTERGTESVGRALRRLAAAGVAEHRDDGWQLRPTPHDEAIRRVAIAGGVLSARIGALAALGGIDNALIIGSVAGGGERSTSDLDLLVVGDLDPFALGPALRRIDLRLGREVNTVVLTREEVVRQVSHRGPFIASVMARPRIDLVGDFSRLIEIICARISRAA